MNDRGFTLIELIMTIALLAVISVISFVSINQVLIKNQIRECENLVLSIKSATKEYVSDNRYNSSFDSDNDKKIRINGNVLTSGKYLSKPIINPFNEVEINAGDIIVDIELNDDYSAKTVVVKNNSGNKINCDNNLW